MLHKMLSSYKNVFQGEINKKIIQNGPITLYYIPEQNISPGNFFSHSFITEATGLSGICETNPLQKTRHSKLDISAVIFHPEHLEESYRHVLHYRGANKPDVIKRADGELTPGISRSYFHYKCRRCRVCIRLSDRDRDSHQHRARWELTNRPDHLSGKSCKALQKNNKTIHNSVNGSGSAL